MEGLLEAGWGLVVTFLSPVFPSLRPQSSSADLLPLLGLGLVAPLLVVLPVGAIGLSTYSLMTGYDPEWLRYLSFAGLLSVLLCTAGLSLTGPIVERAKAASDGPHEPAA